MCRLLYIVYCRKHPTKAAKKKLVGEKKKDDERGLFLPNVSGQLFQ
jgi:hypothetical protein